MFKTASIAIDVALTVLFIHVTLKLWPFTDKVTAFGLCFMYCYCVLLRIERVIDTLKH